MTNTYPFLPITLKSMLIVLFDSNGPDLNLLDPFHFKFHCCALLFLASLVPSAAQSLWAQVRVMNGDGQGMAVFLYAE